MIAPLDGARPAGYVLVAFVAQIVGYAALLAVFPHSHVTPLVAEIRVLPLVALIVLATIAVPAVLLSLGFGTVVSVVLGVRPESLPAVLLANGDVFVFVSAAVIAVTSMLVIRWMGALLT